MKPMSILGSIIGALLPPLFSGGRGNGGSGPGEAGGAGGQNGPDAPPPAGPATPPAADAKPAPTTTHAPTVSLTTPAPGLFDIDAPLADDLESLRRRALAVQAEMLTADLIEKLKTPPDRPALVQSSEPAQDAAASYRPLEEAGPTFLRAA